MDHDTGVTVVAYPPCTGLNARVRSPSPAGDELAKIRGYLSAVCRLVGMMVGEPPVDLSCAEESRYVILTEASGCDQSFRCGWKSSCDSCLGKASDLNKSTAVDP